MKLTIPEYNKSWYCGPYVVAAITGRSFTQVREVFNSSRLRDHNKPVCATWPHEVEVALRKLGYKTFNYDVDGKPTLKQWLKKKYRNPDTAYVVSLTKHFVVVHGDLFIDTVSKHKVNIHFAPGLRSRVEEIIEVRQ